MYNTSEDWSSLHLVPLAGLSVVLVITLVGGSYFFSVVLLRSRRPQTKPSTLMEPGQVPVEGGIDVAALQLHDIALVQVPPLDVHDVLSGEVSDLLLPLTVNATRQNQLTYRVRLTPSFNKILSV